MTPNDKKGKRKQKDATSVNIYVINSWFDHRSLFAYSTNVSSKWFFNVMQSKLALTLAASHFRLLHTETSIAHHYNKP